MENLIPSHNQLWNCSVRSATQPEVTVYLLQMNCFKIEKYSSNLREILPLSLLLAQCGEMISKGAVILIQKRFNDIFLGFLYYDKVNLKKMAQILFNFCM